MCLSAELDPGLSDRGVGCVLDDLATPAVTLINGSRCPREGIEGQDHKAVWDASLPADGVERLWLYGLGERVSGRLSGRGCRLPTPRSALSLSFV